MTSMKICSLRLHQKNEASSNVRSVSEDHMRINRKRFIRLEVDQLLQRNSIASAPIDVERVARNLKILIRRTPTDDDISGFLLRHPGGQVVIGVNTLHHSNRQRFTI